MLLYLVRPALLHPRPDRRGGQGIGEVTALRGQARHRDRRRPRHRPATRERFASEGADVLLVGPHAGPAGGDRRAICGDGGRPSVRTADVARSDQVRGRRRGRARALGPRSTCWSTTPASTTRRRSSRWTRRPGDAVVATNLTGPLPDVAARGAVDARHRRRRDPAQRLDRRVAAATAPFASYNASKAGAARPQPHDGPRAGPARHPRRTASRPGFTHTEMTERRSAPKLMNYLNGRSRRVPMRRLVPHGRDRRGVRVPGLGRRVGITGIESHGRLRPDRELVHPRDPPRAG